MKKKLLAVALTMSMCLASFTACSGDASDNSADADTNVDTEIEASDDTEAETTTEETTEETIAETTAETTPASTIWGEINDLTFGISELDLISYCYSVLDDEEIEGTGIDETVHYSIPSVDASDPDEDGYVTYFIDYNISGTYDTLMPYAVADRTDGWSSTPQEYIVIDYYTGTILCNWENSYTDDGEETAVTIENEDEEITVYASATLDTEITDNESYEADSDNWGWHVDYIVYARITLRAPESYDGMLLAIDTSGWTEADQIEYINSGDDEDSDVEGDIFVNDLTDYRFTWASDLFLEE